MAISKTTVSTKCAEIFSRLNDLKTEVDAYAAESAAAAAKSYHLRGDLQRARQSVQVLHDSVITSGQDFS